MENKIEIGRKEHVKLCDSGGSKTQDFYFKLNKECKLDYFRFMMSACISESQMDKWRFSLVNTLLFLMIDFIQDMRFISSVCFKYFCKAFYFKIEMEVRLLL